MDDRKIYSYHKLDVVDIFDSIEWARENFERFDGEVSFMWNEHVLKEFARLNKERNEEREKFIRQLNISVADMQLSLDIENSDIPFINESDVELIEA